MSEVTENTLLGGRVRLLQPARGYRAAVDPVVLAAAVPVARGRVLDVGAGTGAALLCLLARVPGVTATGLEVVADHAGLARRSLALNGWAARAEVVTGDLRDRPAPVPANSFDHVLTNPPFHGPGTRPPDAGRARAHMEAVPLDTWLGFCLRMLKPRGGLTLIHRADRLDEILAALWGRAGAVEVIPIAARAGRPAKRVIVRARKGRRSPAILHAPFVLHGDGGGYTAAAEAVLRHGAGLDDVLDGVLDRTGGGGT